MQINNDFLKSVPRYRGTEPSEHALLLWYEINRKLIGGILASMLIRVKHDKEKVKFDLSRQVNKTVQCRLQDVIMVAACAHYLREIHNRKELPFLILEYIEEKDIFGEKPEQGNLFDIKAP